MSTLTLTGTATEDLTILASREITLAVNPFTDSQITDNKARNTFHVIGYMA